MFYSLPLPLQHSKSGPESVNDMKRGGAICEQRHSLNKIVLSQSSHQRKQDALGHTLTALQIVYACDAIVSSLRGFVVYNHYNQSVVCSPPSQPFRVTRKCCECGVCCIAAYPISPSFNMDNFTPLERRKSTRVLLKGERSKKREALAVSPVQSMASQLLSSWAHPQHNSHRVQYY